MKFELRDACFAYGADKPLFEHINLSLSQGEILTVLGPNGAGKTSLLRAALFNVAVVFSTESRWESFRRENCFEGLPMFRRRDVTALPIPWKNLSYWGARYMWDFFPNRASTISALRAIVLKKSESRISRESFVRVSAAESFRWR